jgi:hypothetical protein
VEGRDVYTIAQASYTMRGLAQGSRSEERATRRRGRGTERCDGAGSSVVVGMIQAYLMADRLDLMVRYGLAGQGRSDICLLSDSDLQCTQDKFSSVCADAGMLVGIVAGSQRVLVCRTQAFTCNKRPWKPSSSPTRPLLCSHYPCR